MSKAQDEARRRLETRVSQKQASLRRLKSESSRDRLALRRATRVPALDSPKAQAEPPASEAPASAPHSHSDSDSCICRRESSSRALAEAPATITAETASEYDDHDHGDDDDADGDHGDDDADHVDADGDNAAEAPVLPARRRGVRPCFVATCVFDALESNELSLRPGERVFLDDADAGAHAGWAFVTRADDPADAGFVPISFLSALAGPDADLRDDDDAQQPLPDDHDHAPDDPLYEPIVVRLVAFPFEAESDGELSLELGERLRVLASDLDDATSGWAFAEKLAQPQDAGYVPKNHLAPEPRSPPRPSSDSQ